MAIFAIVCSFQYVSISERCYALSHLISSRNDYTFHFLSMLVPLALNCPGDKSCATGVITWLKAEADPASSGEIVVATSCAMEVARIRVS